MKCPGCGMEARFNCFEEVGITPIKVIDETWPVQLLYEGKTTYVCDTCDISIIKNGVCTYIPKEGGK